ncbi:hypothetical protein AVEN_24405-1 [Araneus ventricosus]|uniref:Uncharacterized protein n=1 Tax=Araneus ventricosus TaxID=182803 RepID=A0A4Y2S221_ARAVE|nr:hypothetical protein AVEN_249366-1 [Araneus ventricosus]GBN81973.1 hypothetical protein AVEN_24405-1 [Araneus ventricosus]
MYYFHRVHFGSPEVCAKACRSKSGLPIKRFTARQRNLASSSIGKTPLHPPEDNPSTDVEGMYGLVHALRSPFSVTEAGALIILEDIRGVCHSVLPGDAEK